MLKFNKISESELEIIINDKSVIIEDADFDVEKDIGVIYFIVNLGSERLSVDKIRFIYEAFLNSI